MNLFKTKRTKSTNELIDEIHETFYTEVDRLLEEANIKKVSYDKQTELINKSERLKKLGFTNASDAEKGEEIKIKKQENRDLKEAIQYFSLKYPQYKFITEESVKKICQTYGLIYGDVDKYKGSVPDENISQIEKFKINDNDKAYKRTIYGVISRSIYYVSKKEYDRNQDPLKSSRVFYDRCNFEIAAPPSDFDLANMEVKDFQILTKEIPDPIVLQPVLFLGKKHYLIVTAWGQEASDELVVNEKLN